MPAAPESDISIPLPLLSLLDRCERGMLVALFEAVKVGRFVEDESAELDEFGTPTRFPQNFKPASGNTEILCGLRTGEGLCHGPISPPLRPPTFASCRRARWPW